MTQDERNMLTDLANKIAQTPPPPKDSEAEDFIRTRIGSRPDALYLMTQTVIIQNLALQHAQQEIQELQQRAGQPVSSGSSGSFLGQGQAAPRAQQQYSAPPPPQYAAAPVFGSNPGGAPSFLKGAAQTAAGVAAGALAFEGIQSLFSHPGYGGGEGFGGFGGGGFGGGGFGGAPQEETVVNNYYDNSGDSNVDDNQQFDDSGTDSNYDDGGGSDDGGGGDNFV